MAAAAAAASASLSPAVAPGLRRPRRPRPPRASAKSSIRTPLRPARPHCPKAPKSPKDPLGGVFRFPGRAEKRKVVLPLFPNPSFSLPSIFSLESLCLLFPRPSETRKHACSASRLSPHCYGRPAAALGARGKRWNHAPLLSLSPWKLEVAQV